MDETNLDMADFDEIIEGRISPITLAETAKQLGIENKHPPSIIYGNLFLARLFVAEQPEEAISLISEAKQIAISNNRRREIRSIEKFVEHIGIDIDTV